MPTLKKALPKYRRHRASGQAVVTICGQDHYLGKYGTKASKAEYDRLVGEWVAQGRPKAIVRRDSSGRGITVKEKRYDGVASGLANPASGNRLGHRQRP